jgi:hypothetical protein
LAKFNANKQLDGSVKIGKGLEKLADENAELADELDLITKEEMITAIKKIANAVGVSVSFTYDNKKNKI